LITQWWTKQEFKQLIEENKIPRGLGDCIVLSHKDHRFPCFLDADLTLSSKHFFDALENDPKFDEVAFSTYHNARIAGELDEPGLSE